MGQCDLRCELVVREIADDVWDGIHVGEGKRSVARKEVVPGFRAELN